ncbi:hypothetical protein F4818DRAFT_443182 [Hypoxylon cercidicola]|nr:hypothetical protein F4818DRAFT_443182 [Hypoxylon cercidicola]
MPKYLLPDVDVSSFGVNRFQSRKPFPNVRSDYGTPQLLFFNYIPFIPDDKKGDLDAVLDDFCWWNAWEVFHAESALETQLDKGTLPDDDTIESRIARTNYRAKVVDYLRENSENSWLIVVSSSPNEIRKDVMKAQVNSEIRNTLRHHYAHAGITNQAVVISNILSAFAALDHGDTQKFYLTSVYFKYDGELNSFQPEIHTSSIEIHQSPKEGQEDAVTLQITILDFVFRLEREIWRNAVEDMKPQIEPGKEILKEMMLGFYLSK